MKYSVKVKQMNIKQAKNQIKNAIKAYLTKDSYGDYLIPIEAQRPIFVMGPPGIGKTAIMEQLASELKIGLVSYSMTHHTRQSALGLPFIEQRTYNNISYSVTEYTMSEIIASIYELMEKTQVHEGILFIDEINCVSETLAPAMLQFLQYKTFGTHRIPCGWVIVAAGNPPEYNKSVREFDLVTLDRLKRIDVEPDFKIWKEYAYKKRIHPSILSYLALKTTDFYTIEKTVDGMQFVTARGWCDLSVMIKLYEQHQIEVDVDLIAQYIQNGKIAKEFGIYYSLYNKYKSDYQIDKIFEGNPPRDIKVRASNADFDERVLLLNLLLDGITEKTHVLYLMEQEIKQLLNIFKLVKEKQGSFETAETILNQQITILNKKIEKNASVKNLTKDEIQILHNVITSLEEVISIIVKKNTEDSGMIFDTIKAFFDEKTNILKYEVENISRMFSNVFDFCAEVFGDSQEILILVTELTANCYCTHFISRYGCIPYFKYNKKMLFYERKLKITRKIEDFNL